VRATKTPATEDSATEHILDSSVAADSWPR
jgi:hypothetical protein